MQYYKNAILQERKIAGIYEYYNARMQKCKNAEMQ